MRWFFLYKRKEAEHRYIGGLTLHKIHRKDTLMR